MINPMQLIGMINGSPNPMGVLQNAAQQSPQLQQVMSMVNGQTPAQMRNTAFTLARQKGIDLNRIASVLGIRLP